jgi:hypothetical protein
MDFRRLRGPLLAAIGTMLLAGGSVALATDPSSPPASNGTTAEEPDNSGPEADKVQEGVDNAQGENENDADDPAEADQEASQGDNGQGEDRNAADDAAEGDADAPGADDATEESGASD